MTDKEIIKALECCTGETEDVDCSICPYNDEAFCNLNASKEALALINRQQAEIERLYNHFLDLTKKVKYEAVKEFAERFRVKFQKEKYRDCYVITGEDIDNLLKEMG